MDHPGRRLRATSDDRSLLPSVIWRKSCHSMTSPITARPEAEIDDRAVAVAASRDLIHFLLCHHQNIDCKITITTTNLNAIIIFDHR